MEAHQQRVVDEKAELDEKLEKLIAFFDTPIYADLEYPEQARLKRQSQIMKEYSFILGARIEAF